MTDFLNNKQVSTLQDKNWIVKPKGFYLTLYREDYSSIGWDEICKVVGCSNNSTEVTVLSFGHKEN